jgi:hypothetical protein
MITAYGLLFVIYSIAAYALLLRLLLPSLASAPVTAILLLLTGSYSGGVILLAATILSCGRIRPEQPPQAARPGDATHPAVPDPSPRGPFSCRG